DLPGHVVGELGVDGAVAAAPAQEGLQLRAHRGQLRRVEGAQTHALEGLTHLRGDGSAEEGLQGVRLVGAVCGVLLGRVVCLPGGCCWTQPATAARPGLSPYLTPAGPGAFRARGVRPSAAGCPGGSQPVWGMMTQ